MSEELEQLFNVAVKLRKQYATSKDFNKDFRIFVLKNIIYEVFNYQEIPFCFTFKLALQVDTSIVLNTIRNLFELIEVNVDDVKNTSKNINCRVIYFYYVILRKY